MGIIGLIAKAVGSAAVDSTIDGICDNLENFAKGVGVGKRVDWHYKIVIKGKTLANLKVGVKKTRAKVTYYVGSLKMTYDLNQIHPGCVSAVNTLLSLI